MNSVQPPQTPRAGDKVERGKRVGEGGKGPKQRHQSQREIYLVNCLTIPATHTYVPVSLDHQNPSFIPIIHSTSPLSDRALRREGENRESEAEVSHRLYLTLLANLVLRKVASWGPRDGTLQLIPIKETAGKAIYKRHLPQPPVGMPGALGKPSSNLQAAVSRRTLSMSVVRLAT